MNDIIYIFGMTKRVGTNYLMMMLNQHTDTEICPPIWEDFLTANSDHLVQYAEGVESKWDEWKDEYDYKKELLACLGQGIEMFLRQRAGKTESRLLTKTPSVVGLENFTSLFPNRKCVILVRDGRSTVASYVKAFDVKLSRAARYWAYAAKLVSNLQSTTSNFSDNYLILRYESLVSDPEFYLKQVMDFFALDKSRYEFSLLQEMPVLGSSFFRGENSELHWDPLPVSSEFKSLCRWAHWTENELAEFYDIAGDGMKSLGYPVN